MSGIQRLKSWFFTTTSLVRADGTTGGTRLKSTDKPTQQTFEDLLASTAFLKESSDRAKIYTGSTDVGTEQGLSVLATDAQAKANATQLSDRSLVVSPSQLPTSETSNNSAYEDFPAQVTDVSIDGGTSTRNKFLIKLNATWLTKLYSRIFKQGGVEGDVPIKNSATNYDWSYGNVGNNTTTVNTIANNATFINSLTTNSNFTTAIQTIVTNITNSNPTYFTDNLPVGIIMSNTAVGSLGSKWLIADGTAISRSTYSDLFTLIGTTYGVGNGTTTFNLPNLSQRQISGYDNTAGYTLGATGGAHTQTLIEANLPPHMHQAGTYSVAIPIESSASAAGGQQYYAYDGNDGTGAQAIGGSSGVGNGTSTAFSIKDQYLSLPFYIKVSK